MTVRELLTLLNIKSRIIDLDLKVQIGNCYIDIDSVDIENDAVTLNVFSDLPIFIFPVSPQDNVETERNPKLKRKVKERKK